VNPAPLTVTATNASKVYGASLPTFTATATGLVNGDSLNSLGTLQFSTNATQNSSVGTYSITPAGLTSTNYMYTYTNGTLYIYLSSQFVIWGGNQANLSDAIKVGQDYTFWGALWSSQVTAGNFQANASFKGYADTVSGSTWTSSPGNSSNPPATIGSYIGVIVSTQITKSGNQLTGNIVETVVLKVDNLAGYAPDPGHSASGIVVAVVH
jgi:hypothetical protein